MDGIKLKIEEIMDENGIKIINIWTKLIFRQWLDTCHHILTWHMDNIYVTCDKYFSKEIKKIKKSKKCGADTTYN